MGLGGDLIFTAALREIKRCHPKKRIYLNEGFFSRGMRGFKAAKLLDWIYTKNPSPVFRNNPHLCAGWVIGDALVIKRRDRRNSYVMEEQKDRFLWKRDGHAVEIICANYGVKPVSVKPELYFSKDEESLFAKLTNGIEDSFVAVEPNGKADAFKGNRQWYFDKWQDVTHRLRASVCFVQVGDGKGPTLDGVVDLNGKLAYREAAWVISRASLFVGTVGGLMHTARAVNTESVILYSGSELPSMAGYKENTNLTIPVDCSPCGLLVECPNGKRCMDFDAVEVCEVVSSALRL